MVTKYVNWFDEKLDSFYGDNNDGLVHGVYVYDDGEDFPTDVEWFRTKEEALAVVNASTDTHLGAIPQNFYFCV